MQVLIVEDDEVVQGVLKAYLAKYAADQGLEIQVQVVPEARPALEMLSSDEHSHDVVFLDVRMQQLGGDDIYNRLMQDRPEMLSRIVFVTGYRDDLEARFPGLMLNILDKPFRYSQLKEAMAAVA